MSPKESNGKQIDQNTQKCLAKWSPDCRGNIFKNMMTFLEKLEKKKLFILKEKDAGLAINSMSIDWEVSFLTRKIFNESLKFMLRNLISDPRHIFLIYVVFNTHVNCYVWYIFKVQSYIFFLFIKKRWFQVPRSFDASYIKTL